MTHKAASAVLTLLLASAWTTAQESKAADEVNARVSRIANEFLAKKRTPGFVVGVISGGKRHVSGFGRASVSEDATPGGRTLYEVGSITKVFTALVLAERSLNDGLSLDLPVSKLLPQGQTLPRHKRGEITLLNLATHTAGLPRGVPARNYRNPFADHDAASVYTFLEFLAKGEPNESVYAYSNLGFGLLGHALARRGKTTYEKLVLDLICKPLGLSDTVITLDEDQKKRLAPGHVIDIRANGHFKPTQNWDFKALAGCGALRSTVNDLLTFAEANMGLRKTSLAKAMKASHEPRKRRTGSQTGIALGWHLDQLLGVSGTLVWHNGSTGGYSSYLGFNKDKKLAVVILNNSTWLVSRMGVELLTALASRTR